MTIFLTTHRLEEAERLCDRVAIINTTLRTIGTPDDLRVRLFNGACGEHHGSRSATPTQLFRVFAASRVGSDDDVAAVHRSPSPTRARWPRAHPGAGLRGC